MARSVKLSDDVMDDVRREAEWRSRSIAGQVTHWMRIGRAIERSGRFDHAKISAALAGEVETTELTDEEKEVWLDQFSEKMSLPGPHEEAFFADRRKRSLGVGLDEDGTIVEAGSAIEV